MKINIPKTKAMLFRPTNIKPNQNLSIKIDECDIELVSSFKYLGVILQENLTYEMHFNKVCSEMNARMYMINRNKHSFNTKWLRIFTTSLILSLLDYCIPVWGNLTQIKYDKLDEIMLKLAKLVILKRKGLLNEKNDIFEKMNWLTSEERYILYSLEYVYKHVISSTKTLHHQIEKKEIDNQVRTTRTSNNLILPRLKTVFGQKAFFYTVIKQWNKLPQEIQTLKSTPEFDTALRQYLILQRRDNYIFD